MIPINLTSALATRKKLVDESLDFIGNSAISPTTTVLKCVGANFQLRSKEGFVGLVNQGATCYLNSLLQSIFHIPEFRTELFSWEFDTFLHGDEKACLTRQMQVLFSKLLFSRRGAITTVQLTKSFGWTSADSFLQQDVQECMSVIFDFLIKQCEGSPFGFFLYNFFYGDMCNELRCTKCSLGRVVAEKFKEIQLQVRGFTSLGQSLSAFFAEELLEGVMCDNCNSTNNHKKCVRVAQLPSVLILQLKRFDLDYRTYQRIKLNDRIEIPFSLDLNFAKSTSSTNCDNEIFDLTSVLVHVGSAFAGHYFCYLRHAITGKWFLFNDSSVTELSPEQVAVVFDLPCPPAAATQPAECSPCDLPSSSSSQTANAGASSVRTTADIVSAAACAYMLMYRRRPSGESGESLRKDKETNSDINIPGDLREIVEADNVEFLAQRAEWERQQELMLVRVSFGGSSRTVTVNKTATVADIVDAAYAAFVGQTEGQTEVLTADRTSVRLRVFNSLRGVREHMLTDETKTIAELGIDLSRRSFVLEGSSPDGVEGGDDDGTQTCIQLLVSRYSPVDSISSHSSSPFSVASSIKVRDDMTLKELVGAVTTSLNVVSVDGECPVVLAMDSETGSMTLLQPSVEPMLGVVRDGHTIYVDTCGSADTSRGEESPKVVGLLEYFETLHHMINLYYNNPFLGERECDSSSSISISSPPRQLRIDNRNSLKQLKERISAEIGVAVSSFRMHQGRSGEEWKDLTPSLGEVHIVDGDSVRIVIGTPLTPGQYRLRVLLLSDAGRDHVQSDGSQGASLGEVVGRSVALSSHCEVVVEGSDTVAMLKELLCRQHAKELGLGDGAGEVRLRLRLCEVSTDGGYRVGRVLRDSQAMSVALGRLVDGAVIAVQPNVEESAFTDDDLLVEVRCWRPNGNGGEGEGEGQLTSGIDVVVRKTNTVADLKALIASVMSRKTISLHPGSSSSCEDNSPVDVLCVPEHMLIIKAFAWQLKDVKNVSGLKWNSGVADSSILSGGPWRLQDGSIVVVRDIREGHLPVPVTTEDASVGGVEGQRETGFKLFTVQEQRLRTMEQEQEDLQRKAVMEERMMLILKANMR